MDRSSLLCEVVPLVELDVIGFEIVMEANERQLYRVRKGIQLQENEKLVD